VPLQSPTSVTVPPASGSPPRGRHIAGAVQLFGFDVMHGGAHTPPPSGKQAEHDSAQMEPPQWGELDVRSRIGCDMSVDMPVLVVSSPQPTAASAIATTIARRINRASS
jgi:hypothetical protein